MFLDYHPDMPKPPQLKKNPREPKVPRLRPPPNQHNRNDASFDSVAWQIQWMNTYDDLRKQSNQRIEEETKKSATHEDKIQLWKQMYDDLKKESNRRAQEERKRHDEKEAQIDQLTVKLEQSKDKIRKRNKQKIFLMNLLDKRRELIRKWKADSEAAKKNLNQYQAQIFVSKDYVRNIHSYASLSDPPMRKSYRCQNCPYVTNKKSTIVVHQANCGVEKLVKDMQCSICHKLFDYRRLRLHYNYFIAGLKKPETQQHKANDEHAEYSLQYHEDLLRKHKLLKQKQTKKQA